MDLLRDIGTGLDVHLYETAISHFFGGDHVVFGEIEIHSGTQRLGRQKVRLTSPGWAVKVTTIDEAGLDRFEDHARRFLSHTNLRGLRWINIRRKQVTFITIPK